MSQAERRPAPIVFGSAISETRCRKIRESLAEPYQEGRPHFVVGGNDGDAVRIATETRGTPPASKKSEILSAWRLGSGACVREACAEKGDIKISAPLAKRVVPDKEVALKAPIFDIKNHFSNENNSMKPVAFQ